MVYSPNKVVACIKVGGKVLREDGDSVILPFGSEYSVFVKNLNPVRIKFKVSVDGTDASDGCWLVVNPNSDFDLERYIRNGNLDGGNRFKFIERTSAIEDHRGIKADDGLIRIEYQVEKRPPVVDEIIVHKRHIYEDEYEDYRPPYRGPWRFPRPHWTLSSDRMKSTQSMRPSASLGGVKAKASVHPMSSPLRSFTDITEQGITVPGSESAQKFQWTEEFQTGASEVIVLRLRGGLGDKKAVQAITVDVKPTCVTCGKVNKGTDKFCSRCGTALSLI